VSVLIILPHDPYIRFQQVARESVHYLRLKWIYERIHFDERPIDVAFIGTSHTQSGINSERVEARLQAQGKYVHVVNFAIPHLGRDLEYLIARELLENRKIKTLVIETQLQEARAPHPGFQRLASVKDIVDAPVFINTRIVENFARLPLRQLELFERSWLPDLFGMNNGFNPGNYEGLHFNDTYRLHGFTETRTAIHTREYFKKELNELNVDFANKTRLADRLNFSVLQHNPLYRYNNVYLEKIVELANHHAVQVVFLYIPFLNAPDKPSHSSWIKKFGDMLVPLEIIKEESLWQNADHLNYYGANKLSDWTAGKLDKLIGATADDL